MTESAKINRKGVYIVIKGEAAHTTITAYESGRLIRKLTLTNRIYGGIHRNIWQDVRQEMATLADISRSHDWNQISGLIIVPRFAYVKALQEAEYYWTNYNAEFTVEKITDEQV